MGISSNQARLMTLTARQHDLELRAQSISAKKMITSMESQQMATEYSDALDKYSKMKSGEVSTQLFEVSYWGRDSNRNIVNGTLSTEMGYTKAEILQWLDDHGFGSSYNVNKDMEIDPADFLRQAQADYDGATAKLSAEEKQLDMELTQINTEHNAVKTEYDSVKSLVSDNTDKSFNVFS